MLKKITKQSLEQLAKEMPTLSEYEMKDMVGGVIFFNRSGTFCHGYAGTSDIIRYVHDVDLSQFQSMDKESAERAALNVGTSWGGLSQDEQLANIRVMIGSELSNIQNCTIQMNNMNNSGNAMEIHYNDASLRINGNGGEAFATYGNIYSTLFHENFHARLLSGVSGTGSVTASFQGAGEEKAAYEEQVRNPSFLKTTMEYRIMTIQNYHSVLQKIDFPYNERVYRVQEMCNRGGVDISDINIPAN